MPRRPAKAVLVEILARLDHRRVCRRSRSRQRLDRRARCRRMEADTITLPDPKSATPDAVAAGLAPAAMEGAHDVA